MSSLRNRHLLVADVALLATSPLLLYALRFEGFVWGQQNVRTALTFLICAIPLQITTYYLFGLYRRLWRYASLGELELIFVAGAAAAVFCTILGLAILPWSGLTPLRVPL